MSGLPQVNQSGRSRSSSSRTAARHARATRRHRTRSAGVKNVRICKSSSYASSDRGRPDGGRAPVQPASGSACAALPAGWSARSTISRRRLLLHAVCCFRVAKGPANIALPLAVPRSDPNCTSANKGACSTRSASSVTSAAVAWRPPCTHSSCRHGSVGKQSKRATVTTVAVPAALTAAGASGVSAANSVIFARPYRVAPVVCRTGGPAGARNSSRTDFSPAHRDSVSATPPATASSSSGRRTLTSIGACPRMWAIVG